MIPTIGFFNSKGGIGKTSLVYHLAWMFAERYRVLAVDLDPQTGLTEAFLTEDRLSALWLHPGPSTIHKALSPLIDGGGEPLLPQRETIAINLGLLAGELSVALFEHELAKQWARAIPLAEPLTSIQTSFRDVIQRAAEYNHAELVMVDLGPGFDAINHTALVACTHVIVPVGPHHVSINDLINMRVALERWRAESAERQLPLGYVVIEPPARLDRGTIGIFMNLVAQAYRHTFPSAHAPHTSAADPNCLGTVRWHGSLMPMAREARKPVFSLRPADGALGAHAAAVQDARKDYDVLADRIAEAVGLA